MSSLPFRSRLARAARACGWLVASPRHPSTRYFDHRPTSAFESTLLRILPSLEGVQFVQVGANDGRRVDPIHAFVVRHGWTGVLLEPVPQLFAQLQRTYRGMTELQLVQAALDVQAGHRTIFRLRDDLEQPVPDWAWGLATFDEARIRAAATELRLGAGAVVSEEVPTMTWDQVWARLPGQRCDLIVLDTEGYDIPLLRLAEIAVRRPPLIHFEHACTDQTTRLAWYRELLELGYELATDGQDTTAWRR